MKLYKVEIVAYPPSAAAHYAKDEALRERIRRSQPIADWEFQLDGWVPKGWLTDPEERAAWLERHGNAQFFWPSTKRLYQSRSGAQSRAALIESYGAKVEVVESMPIVWLTADVRRAMRIAALEAELAVLRRAS